jgi:hypothetical protein
MRVRATERERSAEEFFSKLFEHVEPRNEPDMRSQAAKTPLNLNAIHDPTPCDYRMAMIQQFLLKAGVPVKATGLLGRLVASPRKE